MSIGGPYHQFANLTPFGSIPITDERFADIRRINATAPAESR
jgi:hypothetical protein